MKKIREDRPMEEVHRIRLQIYEETKEMNTEEYLSYLKENASRVLEEMGLAPGKQRA